MNPVSSAKTPGGKTFPEYDNPKNIPVSYVSLENPFMRHAYINAKKLHAQKGLTAGVKKMTITSDVIVKDGEIVASGSNGDGWHQEKNRCIRIDNKRPTGQFYDECPGCHPDNHAEQVAIRNAKKDGISIADAGLYLYGHWWICATCWKAITDADIGHVYLLENAEKLFDRTEPETVIGTTKQYAGKMIVIEGSDGSGKTTQNTLLKENLANFGYSVTDIHFPRYTSQNIGGRLLHYATKSEHADQYGFSKIDPYAASLLYAMDRVESKQYIEEALQEFDIVIMDRYYTSNLLHQGAKFTDIPARNKFLDRLQTIEIDLLEIPKPDILIYLTLPYAVAAGRIEQRRAETGVVIDALEKDTEYMRNSIENGLDIAKYLGWNIIEGVETDAAGAVVKEYSKEERQQKLLAILRENQIIHS